MEKITVKRTRAEGADSTLTTDLSSEAKARADTDSKLSDRIDFIVSNTNPSAIDFCLKLFPSSHRMDRSMLHD